MPFINYLSLVFFQLGIFLLPRGDKNTNYKLTNSNSRIKSKRIYVGAAISVISIRHINVDGGGSDGGDCGDSDGGDGGVCGCSDGGVGGGIVVSGGGSGGVISRGVSSCGCDRPSAGSLGSLGAQWI